MKKNTCRYHTREKEKLKKHHPQTTTHTTHIHIFLCRSVRLLQVVHFRLKDSHLPLQPRYPELFELKFIFKAAYAPLLSLHLRVVWEAGRAAKLLVFFRQLLFFFLQRAQLLFHLAGFLFDDTSYFVTVGLSNTVQLRLLGKVFSDVGTPRVSFVLPNSALLLSCSPSSFLLLPFSEGNKDVYTLFNLRESNLTEPGLYEDASDFWKL